MKKTGILTVTSNNAVNNTAGLKFGKEDWHSITALSDEEAIEKFNRQGIDVVLIDSAMEEIASKKLHAILRVLDPSVIILNFNNENADISGEIKAALKARSIKSKSFIVSDDALKGYRMN